MPVQTQQKSLFLVNFLTGISDGLVLPLAACIIAIPFFSGQPAMLSGTGLVTGLFGALVFAWARYSGEREEIHHKHPELGLEEAQREINLLRNIGIDDALTEAMKAEMEQERALWLKEVQDNELGWEQLDEKRARHAALHTGLGFFAGAVLVAVPFTLVNRALMSAIIPLLWILLCLLLLGWYKGKVTDRDPVRAAVFSALRGLVIVMIAGGIAWVVSRLRQG
jgi:VIT1/CCC1 family predicted Fe2+/Mn2+ transporter